MNVREILFTPLDLPVCEGVDIDRFITWVSNVYPQKQKTDAATKKTTSENVFKDQYPWDLTFGAYNGEWVDNFQIEFPGLANYCLTAFGINRNELKSIIFLPVRDIVRGVAFWHRDLDVNGFRFYLVNEHHEKNPLLMRKTVEPYDKIPNLQTPLDDNDPRLQTAVYECKLPSSTHPFYLNNMRSVHSPCVNVPAKRIAVFVAIKPEYEETVRLRSEKLLLRSASKYQDLAVFF